MTERPALRSQRLNQITHAPHTELDALVKAHAPFDSRENFARFVVAQYLFQSELKALYNDPQLIAIVPDLAERCRAEQARLDLADLDTEVPGAVPGAVQNPSLGEAMGWIFGGRAEGWKQFTRILDGLALSAEEEAAAERGAVAAFDRFTELLKHAYAADAALV